MTSLFNASLNASSFFNYPNCNMKSPVTNSTIRVVQRSINYSTGHLAGWDFLLQEEIIRKSMMWNSRRLMRLHNHGEIFPWEIWLWPLVEWRNENESPLWDCSFSSSFGRRPKSRRLWQRHSGDCGCHSRSGQWRTWSQRAKQSLHGRRRCSL